MLLRVVSRLSQTNLAFRLIPSCCVDPVLRSFSGSTQPPGTPEPGPSTSAQQTSDPHQQAKKSFEPDPKPLESASVLWTPEPVKSAAVQKTSEQGQQDQRSQNQQGRWIWLQFFATIIGGGALINYWMPLHGLTYESAIRAYWGRILHDEANNVTAMTEKYHTILTPEGTIDQKTLASLLPTSAIIQQVKDCAIGRFQIVDGMKGTGKSATMAKMCLDHMTAGQPALYLQFSLLYTDPGGALISAIRKNPELLLELAQKIKRKHGKLIIVVEDLHRYMENSQANVILTALWFAAQEGAKIVFTASDYGLKNMILKVPGLNSARFNSTIRLFAPEKNALKKWILSHEKALNEQRKQVAEREAKDPKDRTPTTLEGEIDMYAEVVGVFRDVLEGYLRNTNNNSIQAVTQAAFDTAVSTVRTKLEIICGSKSQGITVKGILEDLCRDQYVSATRARGPLLKELQKANIVRPLGDDNRAYEFHSLVVEVAIRALLNLPASEKPPAKPNLMGTESQGRGKATTIHKLKTDSKHFLALQITVKEVLG